MDGIKKLAIGILVLVIAFPIVVNLWGVGAQMNMGSEIREALGRTLPDIAPPKDVTVVNYQKNAGSVECSFTCGGGRPMIDMSGAQGIVISGGGQYSRNLQTDAVTLKVLLQCRDPKGESVTIDMTSTR